LKFSIQSGSWINVSDLGWMKVGRSEGRKEGRKKERKKIEEELL
jgi:hypothetical protein